LFRSSATHFTSLHFKLIISNLIHCADLVADTALLNKALIILVLSEHGSNVNSGSSPQDHWKIQVAWEESHLGNFRCIYPYVGFERYERYFHQNQSSLFQDTAASRAREECARIQREELEVFIQYFLFPFIELTPQWNWIYDISSSVHILY
jgi:hypothetical protein